MPPNLFRVWCGWDSTLPSSSSSLDCGHEVQVLFRTKEAGRVFQFGHYAHRGLYCYRVGGGIYTKDGGCARSGRELAAEHLQSGGLA